MNDFERVQFTALMAKWVNEKVVFSTRLLNGMPEKFGCNLNTYRRMLTKFNTVQKLTKIDLFDKSVYYAIPSCNLFDRHYYDLVRMSFIEAEIEIMYENLNENQVHPNFDDEFGFDVILPDIPDGIKWSIIIYLLSGKTMFNAAKLFNSIGMLYSPFMHKFSGFDLEGFLLTKNYSNIYRFSDEKIEAIGEYFNHYKIGVVPWKLIKYNS